MQLPFTGVQLEQLALPPGPKKPSGHAVHCVKGDRSSSQVPLAHGVHRGEPRPAYVPTEQLPHEVLSCPCIPAKGLAVPLGQLMHAAWPALGWYVPGEQSEHLDAVELAVYWPGEQVLQLDAPEEL